MSRRQSYFVVWKTVRYCIFKCEFTCVDTSFINLSSFFRSKNTFSMAIILNGHAMEWFEYHLHLAYTLNIFILRLIYILAQSIRNNPVYDIKLLWENLILWTRFSLPVPFNKRQQRQKLFIVCFVFPFCFVTVELHKLLWSTEEVFAFPKHGKSDDVNIFMS